MLCPHGRRIGYVHCPHCNPRFDEKQAIAIGWAARRQGARWESAVEEYCGRCGGNLDDARVVINSIRKAVMSDMPPIPAGMIPEREVIRL
jgi:hypothetical protein